jgi:hypothetical protein
VFRDCAPPVVGEEEKLFLACLPLFGLEEKLLRGCAPPFVPEDEKLFLAWAPLFG